VWDERGLLYSETKGYQSTDATTSYFTYDGNRNRTVFKNGRGNEWDSTYDDFDRRTKLEDPLGHYRTWTYDKRSGVTYLKAYKSDDTLMAQRRIYYDELARPWKTEDLWDGPGLTEDTVTTEFWHDKCGNVTQVQDDNAKNLYRYFDGANRLYEVKDHLNNRRILTFDGNGNVTRVREVEVTSSGTETFDTNQYYDKYNRMYERRVVDRTDSNNYHTSKWWFGSLEPGADVPGRGGQRDRLHLRRAPTPHRQVGRPRKRRLRGPRDHLGQEQQPHAGSRTTTATRRTTTSTPATASSRSPTRTARRRPSGTTTPTT
jgi:hypothetical protein